MEFYEPQELQQKFDIGLSTAYRIHNILQMINLIKIQSPEDFGKYLDALDVLYQEIFPLTLDIEIKDKKKRKTEISGAVLKERREIAKRAIRAYITEGKISRRIIPDEEVVIKALDAYEEGLRLVLHEKDLLFPKREEEQY